MPAFRKTIVLVFAAMFAVSAALGGNLVMNEIFSVDVIEPVCDSYIFCMCF